MPMSKDIFNEELDAVKATLGLPYWQIIPKRLNKIRATVKDQFGGNVEAYIDSLKDRSLINELHRYLQFLTLLDMKFEVSSTNYYKFMEKIIQWNLSGDLNLTGIINFNYDQLLDVTVRSELVLTDKPGKWLDIDIPYIKPHGSSDWIEFEHGHDFSIIGGDERRIRKIATSGKASGEGLLDRLTIVDLAGLDSNLYHDTTRIPIPALMLPFMTKRISNLCPELETAMKKAIEDADQIILVGYGGKDSDFLECIEDRVKTNKKMFISAIGGEDAETVVGEICKRSPEVLSKVFIESEGFSKAVEKLTKDELVVKNGIITHAQITVTSPTPAKTPNPIEQTASAN